MKKFLYILFLLPTLAFPQVFDDFSDGDFTANPPWSGDISKWLVTGGTLQSASLIANDTFYLSTPFVFADSAQWECRMLLDFSTSSANFVDFALVASSADVKSPYNGYFVRVGGTPDEISLYRRDGLTITKIIDGADGRSQASSSGNDIHIRVTCRTGGQWTLSDDNTGSGSNFFLEGQATDATYAAGSHLGLVVKQSTSSFFQKHYFDDISAGPVIADTVPPSLAALSVLSSTALDVRFSEPVDDITSQNVSHYSVDGGVGNPFSALRDATDLSLVHLLFATPFTSGTTHVINVTGVGDLAGVVMADTSATFTWYQAQAATPGDLLINEVLFNARDGGAEFVEIYNASQKVIDLQGIRFTREDLTSHLVDPPVVISATPRLILPGEYLVLSDDSAKVKSHYHTSNPDGFLNMSLPDLLTSEDIILLVDATSQVIDKLHYYESWHFPLLNTVDGVSLERISFGQPTQQQSNWHSASEASGFATPAYENSQQVSAASDGSEVSVQPEIFSPDQDGRDDVLSIFYNFTEPGYTGNAFIYDARGRQVRNLAQNVLLGTSGSLLWDGVSDDNQKARAGIYIVYLEVFNANGDVKHFKKTCVVATRL